MLSVVVPTHQQRERLLRTLDVLAQQDTSGTAVEVVVVVDGGTDGTAEALRKLARGRPLRVLEQPRSGQAAARNRGASVARGELLLFLDDDMVCEPGFLREVARAFASGADVVIPRVRLGSWVAPGPLRDEYETWLDAVHAELCAVAPSVHNMMSGAFAVRRATFERFGGFDEVFTADGRYGGEDAELGHRLLTSGATFKYVPEAVARTGCETDPRRILGREADVGRSHVRLVRAHPELLDTLLGSPFRHSRLHRVVGAAVRAAPPLARVGWLIGPAAVAAIGRADAGDLPRVWRLARALRYWRGVADAGGAALARRALARPDGRVGSLRPRGVVRVLAYHAIADLDDPVLADYTVTPAQFRAQLDALERHRVRWLALDEALGVLAGRPAPPRAVLVTFDDGYESAAGAVDELARRGIPAVLFTVSGHLGGMSTWDEGAASLPLLGAGDLRRLAQRGVEIGSHSRSHADLLRADADALHDEVTGSAADLTHERLGRPRAFAYPYGRNDERVRASVHEAGYRAAFTVEGGVLRADTDPMRIPRIEIHRQDRGLRFLLKVVTGGRSPAWEAAARSRLGWARPLWRIARRLGWSVGRMHRRAAPRGNDGDDGGRRSPTGGERARNA